MDFRYTNLFVPSDPPTQPVPRYTIDRPLSSPLHSTLLLAEEQVTAPWGPQRASTLNNAERTSRANAMVAPGPMIIWWPRS